MKNILFILFFCLFSLTTLTAQQSKADESAVIGLGFFKINQFTTQQMDSLLKVQKFKVLTQNLSESIRYTSTEPKIAVKIIPNKSDSINTPGLTVSGYQSYTINSLTLKDKETNQVFTNKGIRFNFYKNKLYSIIIHRPDVKLISLIDSNYTFRYEKMHISIPYKNCYDGGWEHLTEDVQESILENNTLILKIRPRLEVSDPCNPYIDKEKREIIISDKETDAMIRNKVKEKIYSE